MLTGLTIRNIALIRQASPAFGKGLTVFTGETGAGKSMLMTALSLALGARAEAGHLRPSEQTGEVTATFTPNLAPALSALLAEQGLMPETDGTLILRRQLSLSDTGTITSRAWVNGTPVAISTMAELAGHLVEHHGQHAHTRLLAPATQRELYDTLADAAAEKEATSKAHAAYRKAQQHLEELQTRQQNAEARQELLTAWLEELDALDMEQAKAFADLLAQRRRLSNLGQLSQTMAQVEEGLNNGLSAIRNSSLALDKSLAMAPELEPVATRLTNMLTELEDTAHDLARQTAAWDDPEISLEKLDDILHALKGAARKHQCQPEDLPELYDKLGAEASTLGNLAQEIKEAHAACTEAEKALQTACAALTAKRTAYIPTFQQAMQPLLTALNLPKATLIPHLTTINPTAYGAEELSFLFSANPGQPAQPLARVASGGELSRLMLALKSVLYQKEPPKTLVLDEADTGLGGATASAVGQAMRALAARHQVLTITHHAQVAACAHHHLKIEKSSTDESTQTAIAELDAPAREAELARMLSGTTVTDEARAAAVKLLHQSLAAS